MCVLVCVCVCEHECTCTGERKREREHEKNEDLDILKEIKPYLLESVLPTERTEREDFTDLLIDFSLLTLLPSESSSS